MKYKLVTSEHLEELLQIYESAVETYAYPIGGSWGVEQFKREIDAKKIWGALTHDLKLQAFLIFSQQVDDCDILLLAVAPEYRRQGVMSQFIKHFIGQNSSTQRFFVEVHEGNLGAQNLYNKLGFTVKGKRKDFYGHNQSAILLALGS